MKISNITGFEFFQKLYEGQRFFLSVCLENNYTMNTLEGYPELLERLKRSDYINQSVEFTDFRADGLSISEIFFPNSAITASEFNDCIFIGSNFEGAVFSNCRFSGCSFAKSNLCETMFVNCEFSQCNFEEVKGIGVNFMNSRMRSTIFVKANLAESIFSQALLSDVDFTKTNLSQTNLESTSIAGVNFFRSVLTRANLKKLRAMDEALNLEYAIFQNTRLGEKEQTLLLTTMKKRFFSVV